MELTNVQYAQSGAYTVVVSNALGAVTSAPALLNVIAPIERRPVPSVKVTGDAAGLWNVDYASSLSPTPNWTTFGSVSLTSTSQYCFDLTLPLPSQRFYRAWQMGAPGVMPSLDLHLVPAITLTGNIGGSLRVDFINRFGPTDAWGALDTVTIVVRPERRSGSSRGTIPGSETGNKRRRSQRILRPYEKNPSNPAYLTVLAAFWFKGD